MPETGGPALDMVKKADDEQQEEETGSGPDASAPSKPFWKEVLTLDFSFLLLLPTTFAATDAYEFLRQPKLEIDGGGTGPIGSEVTEQVIDFQGAWWEHVLLGLPYLIMVMAMVGVSRALYRIETNMTRHSKPFTCRDGKVLRWALVGVVAADVTAAVVGRLVPGLLPSTDGLPDPRLVNEGAVGGFWVITLILVLLQMHRIHAKGRQAYENLEQAYKRLEEVA